MGELLAVFKVMPESVETDLNVLRDGIQDIVPDGVTVENFEEKPVAFGLKALHITMSMEDSEDISVDAIEEALAKLEGVESVGVQDVGRI